MDELRLKKHYHTATGAIVMSLGIFLNGAVMDFPLLDRNLRLWAIVLVSLWIWIAANHIKPAFSREFWAVHAQDMLQSFAIGTWVAGTSVCLITLLKLWSHWGMTSSLFLAFDFVLWLLFQIICLRNFLAIMRTSLKWKVDGTILLSTVSTQSLVVLIFTQHVWHVPTGISSGLLLFGGVSYFLCFCLIGARYLREVSKVILSEDWANTNCILHGAMSITGLACAVSGVVGGRLLFAIWLWSLSWFILVELLEIVRAVIRIHRLGWSKAVGTYHVSQWSRIFTFGMFYAFTMNFNPDFISKWKPVFVSVQVGILKYGAWIVLFLIITEVLLMLKWQTVIKLLPLSARKL